MRRAAFVTPCQFVLFLCWLKKPPVKISPDDGWYIDDCPWPLPLPLEDVCACTSWVSWLVYSFTSCRPLEESKSLLLFLDNHSEPEKVADCCEGLAPEFTSLSAVRSVELFCGFLVLRKRPPQPLALLIACWWRDSWRYGCSKWRDSDHMTRHSFESRVQ